MPLDPQAQTMLDADRALGLPPVNTLSPAQRRVRPTARPPAPSEPVNAIEERTTPGPGGELPVRIYRPAGVGPLPALVYFHGGGWVAGSLAQSDAICRTLANLVGCVVISVDYRLAPENKFPAAAEDGYAVTRWAAENGTELGIDPGRIAVGGTSSGANLAAAVPLMAKDRGGPRLAFQFLGNPITDYEFDSPSFLANAEGYDLTRADMIWYWGHYLRTPSDGYHPYASPMRASDVSGLPPALVITAEFDPLRDQTEAYARRLRAAGVEVTCTCYDGMVHGVIAAAHLLDKGQQAVDETVAALRSAFAITTPAPTGG